VVRLLWLHSDKAGCGTYRAYIPGLTLEADGYDNNFLLHAGMHPGAIDLDGADQLANIDVVIFQRCFGPRAQEWLQLARQRGIATIIEMDDDLFTVPEDNPSARTWAQKDARRAVIQMCRDADHVIVSTPPLATSILNRTEIDPSRCTVARNHLHRRVWPESLLQGPQHASLRPDTLVVGWQGSMTHDADFTVAIPALVRILAEFPQVVLRFFGSVPLTLRGKIPEDRFQWSHGVPFDIYPSALWYAHFDVGIAPLVDNAFNRAKSHLKWMEYSALKIPCVASDVYPYSQSITYAKTGYLARTSDDWYSALHALLSSPDRRRAMGEAAYDHVWTTWTADRHIPAWKSAIAAAMAHRMEA
jgi:glycosyltransferase involved in cell wall biosynthesis